MKHLEPPCLRGAMSLLEVVPHAHCEGGEARAALPEPPVSSALTPAQAQVERVPVSHASRTERAATSAAALCARALLSVTPRLPAPLGAADARLDLLVSPCGQAAALLCGSEAFLFSAADGFRAPSAALGCAGAAPCAAR